MTKFYIEISNDEEINVSHTVRIETVEAETPEIAGEMVILKDGEMIEQICKDFEGCELPQPVYDWMNGFELYQ